MDKNNIEQLKKLAKVFNTANVITSEDITEVLKGVLQIMNSFKKDNTELNKETKETVSNLFENIILEHEKMKSDVKRETSQTKDEMSEKLETSISEMKKMCEEMMLSKPKDGEHGKDADEEMIIGKVLEQIKLPENEILTGENIVDRINELEITPENQIDAKHIKNLPKPTEVKGGGVRLLQYLADVNISTPTDGQVLTYDDTTRTWKNEAGGGGTIDGSGTTNELTYWVDSNTVGALAVATYPSLTELAYVKGVTSAIQTQLNVKAPTTSPTFATSITGSYLTASEILITDGSKNIVSAPVATYPSLTELTYLKGVTSAIQTQLNAKGTGSVTSVAMTVPTGLTISGSPVTTSGTLAVALDTGYVIPLQSTLDAKLTGNGTAGYVPYYSSSTVLTSEAHFNYNSTTHVLHVHGLAGDATDGLLLESDNGTDIAILGAANTANGTWYGNHNFEGGTLQIGKNTTTLGKITLFGNTSGSVTIQPNAIAGSGIVLTAPATTGTIALTSDIPAAGANTALSNLASVAINTTLVSDTDNTDALGTSAIAWSDLFLGSGGVITWNSAPSTPDITLTHSADTLTLAGGNLALGTNSLTLTGSIGATGARATKVWTADLESTNMPTVGGTAILTSLTAPQFTTIELGHATQNTLSASSGILSIEGVAIPTISSTDTLSNKTLTAPKFVDLGFIADANGNELLIMDTVASAVNEITLKNAATTTNPGLTATGGDSNVGIDITTKGTGTFNIKGNATQPGELRLYEDTDLGTNFTAFKVGTQSADISYVLPTAQGAASTTLQNDGSGNLSWAAGGSANPGWDFVSYTTGTGTTLDVSSLDLSTDLAYKVIVHLNTDSSGTNGSFISLRISGSSSAEYDEIVSRNRFTGGAASSGQEGLSANQNWYITGTDGGAIPSSKINTAEILLTRGIIDGTNYRVMARWEAATAERNDGTNDIIHWTGAGFNSGQANVTALNFLRNSTTGSPTQTWKVWVFKAATS